MTANKANTIPDCTEREDGSPGMLYTLLNPHSTRDIINNKLSTQMKKKKEDLRLHSKF